MTHITEKPIDRPYSGDEVGLEMDFDGMATGGNRVALRGRVDQHDDLAALSAVEPDVLLADRWSAQFELESLPYDLIDQSETETRALMARLDHSDVPALHAILRAMSAQAFARAIEVCHQAAVAGRAAGAHRARAELARKSDAHAGLERIAIRAERHEAIIGLAALRAAHHARGVDAAVSLKLIGIDFSLPFGMVGPMPMQHAQDR